MITSNDLDNIWKTFIYSGGSEFEFLRLDSGISIPEINIGLNSKHNRCLLLELPKNHNVDFQTTIKQNLTLSFFYDTDYIVLELTESVYCDLFNDLIISIYQKIYLMSDVDEYSKIFIRMFYKWSEFFIEEKTDKLSQGMIKGLFGELFVLKNLILETNSSHLNDVLNSWKGPFDEGQDFILNKKNIEVKCKNLSTLNIKISSEYQLESEDGKVLELLVLSLENNPIDGQPLSLLLAEVKELVINKLGDYSIILEALSQKNITQHNIFQYDNFRFQVLEQIIYNCNEDFPKLLNSNTPKEINNIKYTLGLSHLNEFILSIKKFDE
ncbi:MAG: PD-(D/E)XK motif protein [gamma proteobacterium symbiont of Taylorina sp.]|nr:PD-(D/E)XK motif protein [gamma proteobacterium symbiont of Taylorina sp.]